MDVDDTDLDSVDLTDLDLFVGGFPDELFTRLRREAPVWWHPPTEHTPDGGGVWVGWTPPPQMAAAAHVSASEAAAMTFSSERAPAAEGGGTIIEDLPYGFASGVLLNMMDDPRHQLIRRLVTPSVAPRALNLMEAELRERAARIVDAIADRGRCDLLAEVAVELPLQAVAALMGVPDADRHDLLAWSNATLDYEGRELGETNDRVVAAAASMADYGSRLIADKKRSPGADIISVVANAEIDDGPAGSGPLTELELLMFFNLLVVAGSETARNSIALGMVALIEHPDQLDALVRQPGLMPTAVEEILRWTTATLYNRRTATRTTVIGGQVIEEGDKVTLWWPSANRDADVFDQPFRFDITRTPNPHLTFGHRTHYCMGANLARLEIRVILEELLGRLDGFALGGPVERVRTNKHAGVCKVPMTFRPRTPG
jgi:cytochrome P450